MVRVKKKPHLKCVINVYMCLNFEVDFKFKVDTTYGFLDTGENG